MIASWMAYVLLVGVLFAGAAHVLELAMRSLGRSTRWTWLGAMAASVLVPLWVLAPTRAPASEPPVVRISPPGEGLTLVWEPVTQIMTVPHLPPNLDPWLISFWIVLSLGVIFVILRATAALSSVRREWTAETVNGRKVLVSEDYGPAVVGITKPDIVLPRWVLSGAQQDRELMIRHEEEHLAAGDAPLLLGALLLGALLPWNLSVWWMNRRLRLAIEIDCDRRVLEGASSARRYAHLLVQVNQQMRPAVLRGLGLARPASFLEKRILAMTTASLRRPRLAFLFGPLAGLLVVWACSLEPPTSDAPEEPSDIAGPTAAQQADPSTSGETSQASPDRTITIHEGSQAILTMPDSITRAGVGDPTIADVMPIPPNQVVINGKNVGSTILTVWSSSTDSQRSYKIDVVPPRSSDMAGPTAEQDADPSTPGETLQTSPVRTVTIYEGSQAILEWPDTIRTVTVGDHEIADFTPMPPHSLRVNGLTEGSTTLIVWTTTGSGVLFRINVVADRGSP